MKKLLLLGALLVSAVGYSQDCATYTNVYDTFTEVRKEEKTKVCINPKTNSFTIKESEFKILFSEKTKDNLLDFMVISLKTYKLYSIIISEKGEDVFLVDLENENILQFYL